MRSAHKEADVDVNVWDWNASGHYLVTVTATTPEGKVLDAASVTIAVPSGQ